ncbi:MAG: oligosaccharide flippase family protein [Phycisphaerae bacterium]|nr:oligosaccharide flippase family protein [Gemmatimonadaceae bacterium]
MSDALRTRVRALTDEKLLRKNVVLSLAGWALPAIAAFVAIPLLSRDFGDARYGLLALAWSTVGVFSLIDFGLGRALTRLVADRVADHRDAELPSLIWTANWIVLALTGVFALALAIAAPTIATSALKVPAELVREATGVVWLLAFGLPFFVHGVVLRGVMEAVQQFDLIVKLRVPLGLVTYAGPLLVLPFAPDARVAVAIVVAGRVLYWVANIVALNRVQAGLSQPRRGDQGALRELLNAGGWITVSNLVSPLLVQGDRFVMAWALPIAATGYYVTAAEVATKLWLFTAALQPVLFAALAAAIGRDAARAIELLDRGARVTLLVLFLPSLLLAVFGTVALQWWLGDALSPDTAIAMRWLTVAVYVNCVAQVPYAALQGGADVRGPALLHLAELPLYGILLFVLMNQFGVAGVAAAWCARMSVDTIGMWVLAARSMPGATAVAWRTARLGGLLTAVLSAAAWWGGPRA